MSVEDLWGEIPLGEKQQTPMSILQEQSILFNKKAGGDIESKLIIISKETQFEGLFRFSAPKLGNFTIDLFNIHYGIGLYPVRLVSKIAGLPSYKAKNITEFKEQLKLIFVSKSIRGIILKIRTQIASME